MKRSVKASVHDTSNMDMQFSMLKDAAWNAGYDMTVDDYNIMLTPKAGEQYMPKMTVRKVSIDKGAILVYDVNMQFPDVNMNSDSYPDTAEYAVDQFMRAAKLATQIQKYEVHPFEEYED